MPEAEPEGRARSAKPEVQDCAEEGDGAEPGRAGRGLWREGGRRAAALSPGCSRRHRQGFPPGSTGIALCNSVSLSLLWELKPE